MIDGVNTFIYVYIMSQISVKCKISGHIFHADPEPFVIDSTCQVTIHFQLLMTLETELDHHHFFRFFDLALFTHHRLPSTHYLLHFGLIFGQNNPYKGLLPLITVVHIINC